jgi:metal-responsive CopG/Arc/MetJ family transcriptional regulator
MKTAVSIPDEIFERADRLAKRGGRSRSDLYSAALKEYIERHGPEDVTDAMNRVCDAVGQERDGFTEAVARRVLERTEW